MTPRTGQKKTGKQDAPIGGSRSQAGAPNFLLQETSSGNRSSIHITKNRSWQIRQAFNSL
jgi:hypothetical protein